MHSLRQLRSPNLDVDAARRYLSGVRDMAAEAPESADPRVTITALHVLQLAPRTIIRKLRLLEVHWTPGD
jgi:hypothetical protein